ncbi:MAG TPA: glutamate formimidoyltransferase [Methylomirabilota bacterium]|jgi:glutamate formiminotransferase|nr:glutamate formimidoyltransferase [Methylomirabilota bacterium]
MLGLLECIPNVSEGKDAEVLNAIAGAIQRVATVRLLDRHADPDHNRAVFTLAGPPEAVVEAALAAGREAVARIDMRAHAGVHPRIGAVDVVPFVPLDGCTMADAIAAAHRFGLAFAAETGVPVFFYGAAARRPERRELPQIRLGQYEGLPARLADPAAAPDTGPASFVPRSGATAVGAREPLVAFNVWLDTDDLAAARAIARAVRASAGGLPGIQAMGVRLASRGCTQVSMNLTDLGRTSLWAALQAVTQEAARRGIAIRRCELVGLCPERALTEFRARGRDLPGFGEDRVLERVLARAV